MAYPPQPPPSAAPPKKKGLPPLAWVAIGCGALIVIAGLVVMGLVGFAGYKLKQVAKDIEDKPVTTIARMYALANPELELVEADEETRRITFRNTKTGETLTVDADDIKEGRISFETPQGKMTIDAEGGQESGTVTLTTEEGTAVLRGGTDAEGVPDWVPRYPGAEVTGTFSMDAGDVESGTFVQATDDSIAEVAAWFEGELEGAGYAVQSHSMSGGGRVQRTLIATSDATSRTVTVTVGTSDGRTQAAVQYGSGSR
jgi:hypothetical protein